MLKLIDVEDFVKYGLDQIGRHKNRTNINVNYSEDYFNVAIPFYVDFIQQLKNRFSNHERVLSSLYFLIPNTRSQISISVTHLNLYSDFID